MPTRQTLLSATTNTFPILQLLSGRCSNGFDMMVSESVLYVPRVPLKPSTTWAATHAYLAGDLVKPTARNGHMYQAQGAGTSAGAQPTWPVTVGGTVFDGGVTWLEIGLDIVYDDNVIVTMGAGTNNVVRFNGLFRRFDFSLYPRAVGLVCFGHLVRAQQYENNDEGIGSPGGLDIIDLLGTTTGTDQALVVAALGKVPNLTVVGGNIAGTGITFGGEYLANAATPFLWRNGQNPSIKVDIGGKGETALEYIQRIDAISAVYTNSTSAAGFYRLYEQVGGTIRRALLGSRPRTAADFTFTEGTDIEAGSSSREYPIANRVYVQGFDFVGKSGKGLGPVSNILSSTIQGSNPFMPIGEKHTYTFSSPLIERGLEADAGGGISAERIASALMLDVNRETVRCTFTTPLDYLMGLGTVVLIQGAGGGGVPDRFGIGENLWIVHVDNLFGEDGHYSQQIQCLGGGLPDNYTSAPPV